MLGLIEVMVKSDAFERCHKYCSKHILSKGIISWAERNGALAISESTRNQILKAWKDDPQQAQQKYVKDHLVCCISTMKSGQKSHYLKCTSMDNLNPSTYNQHLFNCHFHQPLLIEFWLLSYSFNIDNLATVSLS